MSVNDSGRDAPLTQKLLGELPPPVAKPCLIIVSGLPGSGKSSFSRQLAARLPSAIVESDAVRKALYPSPTYGGPESARVFRVCHALIEQLLRQGRRVIFDATNLIERHRERVYNIADKLGVKLIIVLVEAPPEVMRQRLERRHTDRSPADNSDADLAVHERMMTSAERIGRNHFVVDTSKDVRPAIRKVIREAQQ